jgi:hypothetical protein
VSTRYLDHFSPWENSIAKHAHDLFAQVARGGTHATNQIGSSTSASGIAFIHQSSHLGDEFVLRTRLERVNLSYEGVDLKLSYDLSYGFRICGRSMGARLWANCGLRSWSSWQRDPIALSDPNRWQSRYFRSPL